ncbi:hypothetical protein DL764_007303 [Monosporascus ibericus]|uniref:Uncharacterized protein n=1 Tax=Monosporascus ibericus TaxID=155417 RepID=A0A4V1X9R9_9PEZI|nr:hypothetical protein DL764_007303 [Monosporascus ibericus]
MGKRRERHPAGAERPLPTRQPLRTTTRWPPRSTPRSSFDFVLANADIIERDNFYEKVQTLSPPKPEFPIVDIGFNGFVYTPWLARHYFRATSGEGKDPVWLFH